MSRIILFMHFALMLTLIVFPCCICRPLPFKSFAEFDTASVGSADRPGGIALFTTTVNPSPTTHKLSFFSGDNYEWLKMVLNVVVGAVASGGFVCSCWCGIKLVRNGCECKSAWFYPKSFAEYKRRKEVTEDYKMVRIEGRSSPPLE